MDFILTSPQDPSYPTPYEVGLEIGRQDNSESVIDLHLLGQADQYDEVERARARGYFDGLTHDKEVDHYGDDFLLEYSVERNQDPTGRRLRIDLLPSLKDRMKWADKSRIVHTYPEPKPVMEVTFYCGEYPNGFWIFDSLNFENLGPMHQEIQGKDVGEAIFRFKRRNGISSQFLLSDGRI